MEKTIFNFNTSYVSVLLDDEEKYDRYGFNFNTSYVSVLHKLLCLVLLVCFYFNTSYVSVLPTCTEVNRKIKDIFQYILCIGFTGIEKEAIENYVLFQYILCIGFTSAPALFFV